MKHTLGIVLLAHTNYHRVEILAMHLADSGCPVVIHFDQRSTTKESAKLKEVLNQHDLISFVDPIASEWGRYSLVDASILASEKLLADFPEVNHVMLTSGSCLPARPISQLKNFLDRHQGSDFIESISIENEQWVKGGLNKERFTLYFPFSWRRNRRMFDLSVLLQRKLKVNRGFPEGIVPYLGSQWWCLTKRTLTAILNDPKRSEYDKYFKSTWIPDESYFQTLARKHSEKLESRSLTWSRFDRQGKPFLLYDDHLDLIAKTDCFMVRKVWFGADGLYDKLLDFNRKNIPISEANNRSVDQFFDRSAAVSFPSKRGQKNSGRFPMGKALEDDFTARGYTVIMGVGPIFDNFSEWLNDQVSTRCHGDLFSRDGVFFENGANCIEGNLTNSKTIRNLDPQGFLENLIWNCRDSKQCFTFELGDNQKARDAIFKDQNATIILIDESWIMHFWKARNTGSDVLSKAERLLGLEVSLNNVIKRSTTRATILHYDLQFVLENTLDFLQEVAVLVGDKTHPFITEMPKMTELKGFNSRLNKLRNHGFKLKIDPLSKEKESLSVQVESKEKLRLVKK